MTDKITIELMIAPDGDLCILHNLQFPAPPQWAEFDSYTNRLLIVFAGGQRTEMFEVTQENAIPFFTHGDKILLVTVDADGQPVAEIQIPLTANTVYHPTHKKKTAD